MTETMNGDFNEIIFQDSFLDKITKGYILRNIVETVLRLE